MMTRNYLTQVSTTAQAHAAAWEAYRQGWMAARPLDPRTRARLRQILHRFHEASQALASLPPPPPAAPEETGPHLQQVWQLYCQLGQDTAAYAGAYLRSLEGEPLPPAVLDAADQRVLHARELYQQATAALRAAKHHRHRDAPVAASAAV